MRNSELSSYLPGRLPAEDENGRLKKIVAQQALDIDALKGAASCIADISSDIHMRPT